MSQLHQSLWDDRCSVGCECLTQKRTSMTDLILSVLARVSVGVSKLSIKELVDTLLHYYRDWLILTSPLFRIEPRQPIFSFCWVLLHWFAIFSKFTSFMSRVCSIIQRFLHSIILIPIPQRSFLSTTDEISGDTFLLWDGTMFQWQSAWDLEYDAEKVLRREKWLAD